VYAIHLRFTVIRSQVLDISEERSDRVAGKWKD